MFSDTVGFSCIYGSQEEVCSVFYSEVEREIYHRQYVWDWSILRSLTTLIFVCVLIVMVVIVWLDACHIRNLRNFYRDM